MNSKLLKQGLAIYVIAGSMFFPSLVTSAQEKEIIGDYCSEKVEATIKQYQDTISRAQTFSTGVHVTTVANVTVRVLNVRAGQGTDTSIIDQVTLGTEQQVIGQEQNGWVPVQVGEQQGYVYSRYVKLEQKYSTEVPKEESQPIAEETQRQGQEKNEEPQGVIYIEEKNLSEAKLDPVKAQEAKGQAVIDYACQFIGNPYVWGGTDLENGADCSGFVQSVYKHFGVNLPRTSGEQRGAGVAVSYDEAMPGDIICYSGHVGLYMGDGKIVNAIGRKYGINISSATHKKILSVRRVL